MVERCRDEGSPDGVYLYHVADMSDPQSAVDLIQVNFTDPESRVQMCNSVCLLTEVLHCFVAAFKLFWISCDILHN